MISAGYKSAYQQGYSDAVRNLKKEPKTRWIPVTEELPEESDEYLVSVKLHPESKPYTDSAFYNADNEQWEDRPSYEYDMVTDITNEVIAWMPLPAPYEPQESEGDEE